MPEVFLTAVAFFAVACFFFKFFAQGARPSAQWPPGNGHFILRIRLHSPQGLPGQEDGKAGRQERGQRSRGESKAG